MKENFQHHFRKWQETGISVCKSRGKSLRGINGNDSFAVIQLLKFKYTVLFDQSLYIGVCLLLEKRELSWPKNVPSRSSAGKSLEIHSHSKIRGHQAKLLDWKFWSREPGKQQRDAAAVPTHGSASSNKELVTRSRPRCLGVRPLQKGSEAK